MDYDPKISANTGYWIPTIVKVDNGFIVQIQSPSQEIKETFVDKSFDELIGRLKRIFEEENKCG